ncbi:MAG: hypothetical protein JO208_08100 [Alphaproteobacteria bacterium]|nr:hypothetical protein [Alphaproteobacteria bacterium]
MPQANSHSITPERRKRIEDRIELLIGVLDAQDAPTEELEDIGDQEPDNDGEGDDCDAEPSLGSRGSTYDADYFDQRHWAGGAMNDAEGDEHDGREPDEDGEQEIGWPEMVNQERALNHCRDGGGWGGEPSLGSVECVDQRRWAAGGTAESRVDLEEQCEDEGHDSDSEPDTAADLEAPCAPFQLVQDGAK